MENSVDTTAAIAETQEPQIEETVSGETSSPVDNPQEELNALIEARTGLFEIALDIEDLKWLKNQCNSKFSFKGPNDGFMLINAYIGLNGALEHHHDKDATTSRLTASTVEALALLVNRYEGTGVPSAQKIFKVAVALQNVIAQFRDLDSQIDALEKAMQHANQEETPETENPSA